MHKFQIEGLEELSREQMKEIEGGCSVSCSQGHYACCNPDNCTCVATYVGPRPPDDPEPSCGSGGPGSTSCST